MSDIPEARRQLLMIARMADADTAGRIRHVVSKYMTRQKYVRQAPVKSRNVTPDVSRRIREMALKNPNLHLSEIASSFGVNQGRVSEVLAGKRK